MITIFTVFQPVTDQCRRVFWRALQSWFNVEGHCQLLICTKDASIKEFVDLHEISVLSDIDSDEYGYLLLGSMFQQVIQRSKYDIICYIDCNIHIHPNLIQELGKIKKKPFVALAGQTQNSCITSATNDVDQECRKDLAPKIIAMTKPRDLVLYPRLNLQGDWWKSWLIFNASILKIPTIDISRPKFMREMTNFKSPCHEQGPDRSLWLLCDMKNCLRSIDVMNGYLYAFTINNSTHIVWGNFVLPAFGYRYIFQRLVSRKITNEKLSELLEKAGYFAKKLSLCLRLSAGIVTVLLGKIKYSGRCNSRNI